MNHVPARNRHAEEISRIEEIVRRHQFPDIVVGFDVELDEFNDIPIMWITFKTAGRRPTSAAEWDRRIATLGDLISRVKPDLFATFEDRSPHFRFKSAEPSDPVQH